MKRFTRRAWAWLLLGALSGCGTLPQPFYGNSGPVAARLAVPVAPILMVPPVAGGGAAASLYAQALATALAANDVPSIAGPIDPANWRLLITAAAADGQITPHYTVVGPDRKRYGQQDGAPVPAAIWQSPDTGALTQEAQQDATHLITLLSAIDAQVQGANPNSLENRPPRLFMDRVTGAPGDGDDVLALNMQRDLPGSDDVMTGNKALADFIVDGRVKATPQPGGQLLVEIDWDVFDTNHRKIGQVTQLHVLKATDITPHWGDVAAAVASEAASGVQQVVINARLHKAAAVPPAT
jgi:hypothetical protein